MKILYFHQHFSTPNGSTGTRSYEFSKALIRAGHEVTIICGSYWIADSGLSSNFINGRRLGIVEGIRVIELELPYSNSDNLIKRTLLFLKYSLSGIQIALKEDYDLLFSTSTPLTASIPGIVAKYLRNKPFVFEVRDLWPELPRAMGVISNPFVLTLLSILETISYKSADRCVALAPGIAEGIRRKYPDKEVIIIPNGSDEFVLKSINVEPTNKFVAAFTGAHGVANGLDALLDVAQELQAMGQDGIEFQFIGDGKLKERLIGRVHKEKITNCVFLDPMPKTALFAYLKTSVDVGLMVLDNIPAFYNGTSPNKFFDYLSLGLPVINNYPGWLAKLIEKHNCGIVVKPGDPKQFAQAIVSLKENEKLRTRLGTNARKLSETKFNRAYLADKFVNYLSKS